MTAEEDLKKAIEWLEKEPQYWPGEDGEPKELPRKPTPEQMRDCLAGTAGDTVEALNAIRRILEDQASEIARLKGHRHDTTKAYSGRPEL
jgi:hypothetical protein